MHNNVKKTPIDGLDKLRQKKLIVRKINLLDLLLA